MQPKKLCNRFETNFVYPAPESAVYWLINLLSYLIFNRRILGRIVTIFKVNVRHVLVTSKDLSLLRKKKNFEHAGKQLEIENLITGSNAVIAQLSLTRRVLWKCYGDNNLL
uniref:Uncharacterized protein n=1 Tax=Glossina brevipalpis TaxID=37001 RepID=A0A1A9WLM8_9MUSC